MFCLSVLQIAALSNFYVRLEQINVRLQVVRLRAVGNGLMPIMARLDTCKKAYGTDFGDLFVLLRTLIVKESVFVFLSDSNESLRLDDEWMAFSGKLLVCLENSCLNHDFSHEATMLREFIEWQSAIRAMIVTESMWLSLSVGQVASDILHDPHRATCVLERQLARLSRMTTSPSSIVNAPMPTS